MLQVLFVSAILLMHQGLATNFAPHGDPFNPDAHAACLHRDLRNTDVGLAHPTLPCNSKVFVYNKRTKRSAVVRVVDRGPRNAAIDLAPAAARLLHANGWEQVVFIPLGGIP